MSETDKMINRFKIDSLLTGFSKEEENAILKEIEDFKELTNSEFIKIETAAIIIFLYKKMKK